MGIIQQVVTQHFGVKSAPPRCHWMTPQHGTISWHVRLKFRSSWSNGVPFCAWMTLDASFSACGTSLLAWWFWTARFATAAVRPNLGMRPAPVHNSRRLSTPTTTELLGNTAVSLQDTRRSVKPRAVSPEKALDSAALAAYVKKVFDANSSPTPPPSSASATKAWRSSSLSDHFLQAFLLFASRRSR